MILDQSKDLNGQQIYRLVKLFEPPDFVKQASIEKICGPANGLHDNALYAHSSKRAFPCHSKAATWVSMAFFLDTKDSLNPFEVTMVEKRLDKFAGYHGIQHLTDALKQQHLQLVKSASPVDSPNDYALITEMVDGSKKYHYPLRNALEVKTAAAYLQNYRDHFGYRDRQAMARKILDKTVEFGAALGDDLHDFVEKQAGVGLCSAEDASKLLWERITLLNATTHSNTDLLLEMTKAAKAILETPDQTTQPDNLEELAEFVDRLDEGLRLKSAYGQLLSRPEEVLFAVTKRAASKMASSICELNTGSVFNLQDMDKLSLCEIRDVLGDNFADAVSSDGVFIDREKLADVMKTMPRPDAEMFERLVSKRGIQPCLKEASFAPTFKPTEEETKEWAAHYLKHRNG